MLRGWLAGRLPNLWGFQQARPEGLEHFSFSR